MPLRHAIFFAPAVASFAQIPATLPGGHPPLPESGQRQKLSSLTAAIRGDASAPASPVAIQDKKERGSLRKGAYYLAHIAYLRREGQIDKLVTETARLERKGGVARKFIEAVTKLGKEAFHDAEKTCKPELAAYMKEGANEDAALKNSKFAEQIDKAARPH